MPPVLAVEWENGIEDAFANVVSFVPKLIGFLALLLIGYFVARAIAAVIDRLLERVGFDRALQRGGLGRSMAQSGIDASDLVSKVVFYSLLLFAVQLAFGVFGANPVSDLLTRVIAFLPKVLVAMVILVVAAAIAAFVRDLVQASLRGSSSGRAIGSGVGALILVIGVFAALNQLQVAPAIVNGLFYWFLFVTGGAAVVALGGSGIGPLRSRWERALTRIETEMPAMRGQTRPGGPGAGGARRTVAEAGPARVGSSSIMSGGGGVARARAKPGIPGWVWATGATLLGLVLGSFLLGRALSNDDTASAETAASTLPPVPPTDQTFPAPASTQLPAPATSAVPANAAPTTTQAPAAARSGSLVVPPGQQRVLPLAEDRALGLFSGQPVEGRDMPVQSVVSNEGFWVGEDARQRVFLVLPTQTESPIQVREGQRVKFTGRVQPLPPNFAAFSGVSGNEGAAQLNAQGQYVQVENIQIVG